MPLKPVIRREGYDALAFLMTAVSVLAVNAVLAVALGCSLYVYLAIYHRVRQPRTLTVDKIPAGQTAT